ncbi:hypothetical protein ACFQX7_29640 [Luedemannella flava]
MTHRSDRTLDVRSLARVEGEGAMRVRVRDGPVEDACGVTALDWALDTARWVATFEFPDFRHDHEMALTHPDRYAIERGTVVTAGGLAFRVDDFEKYVVEDQVPHSTALHARLRDRGHYLTGPAARYTLNRHLLSPLALEIAAAIGLGPCCDNPTAASWSVPGSVAVPPRRPEERCFTGTPSTPTA